MTGELSRNIGENVGSYAIKQNNLSAGNNYSIDYQSADLTITPAQLLVKANAENKVYGDNDPALSYQANGFKLNDNSNIITGELKRNTGENVGNYAIKQNNLSAGNNYTVKYQSADLSINPAQLTVKANAENKVYGDNDPALTYQATGFKLKDNQSIITGELNRNTGENVGNYAIKQNNLSAGNNYKINYQSADLTITPATLNVKANNESKYAGNPDPALTYQANGFKFKDNRSIMTGQLARQTGEDDGTYSILQNTLSAGKNYTINYRAGLFTIKERMTPEDKTVKENTETSMLANMQSSPMRGSAMKSDDDNDGAMGMMGILPKPMTHKESAVSMKKSSRSQCK
jgi:hypothetical protein